MKTPDTTQNDKTQPKDAVCSEKKGYFHKDIESRFYAICEERGYFEVNANAHLWDKNPKTFCIMMPPPNVTGALHIGHALTFSLQDIMVRFKRMQGYKTLYQPGLDHAGIATQNIVEKQLLSQGLSKEKLGREAFVEKVWEWKEQSGGEILHQMRYLGITPAWSRLRFTMDKGLQNAVKRAFVEWYNRNLIIQGDYMVNWCVKDGALSDIEVEYQERQDKLYHLRYFLAQSNTDAKDSRHFDIESSDSQYYIIVATTRPETYFGDTAVMVNPNDERYKHLVGKNVNLPLLNKEIPIIADERVDMDFGSGCVKVTPAHDYNDYEVGKAHHLPFITIFNEKGILNETAGEFAGLERMVAREKIVEKLQKAGFIEKIEDYTHQVGVCYRCGNIIEPYISKQWFVKAQVAKDAIKRVNSGELTFFPPQWLNNYNAWMRELKDWCISRQLWWGHRIPVWYCECKEVIASIVDNPTCPRCQKTITKQDEDVLDTWFSSGLWAFSTLGWGNEVDLESAVSADSALYDKGDLEAFYPNELLITGFDILFFWVARMLLSGESLLKQLPFKDVYLHALVRDKHGQKMSKSKGNVINPLDTIEIYGADTLRFTLAFLCAQGRDVRLSTQVLETYKNFTNKLYNAAQFLLLYQGQINAQNNIESNVKFDDLQCEAIKTSLGKYMLYIFSEANREVIENLQSYRFNDGASVLYRFLWGEFCDWGIELAKADKDSIVELGAIFKSALLLLHPYMPFITDYLWHMLNGSQIEKSDSIMIMRYPHIQVHKSSEVAEFGRIKDVIISFRRLRAMLELGNAPLEKGFVMIKHCDRHLLTRFVKKLARINEIVFVDNKPQDCVGDVGETCECFVELANIDISGICTRLEKQAQKIQKEIEKLQTMLSNEKFLQNAPSDVLAQNKEALNNAKARQEKILKELNALKNV